jgi:hypothetical protein
MKPAMWHKRQRDDHCTRALNGKNLQRTVDFILDDGVNRLRQKLCLNSVRSGDDRAVNNRNALTMGGCNADIFLRFHA